jgi:hypothetical protein
VERGHELTPQRRHAQKAEQGDDDQKQRIDGHEPVPTQSDDVLIGIVIAELLDDAVADSDESMTTLPVVASYQHMVDIHWGRRSVRRCSTGRMSIVPFLP